MLQVDYTESYNRIGVDITQNVIGFFKPADNSVAFSTNIFTDNKVQITRSIPNEASEVPNGVTLLIDGITIFSTNPNILQYFPLRLSIDNKPSIEFTQPDFQSIAKYEVIDNNVGDLLIPNVVSAKYGNPVSYVVPYPGAFKVSWVAEYRGIIYYSDNIGLSYYSFDPVTGISTTIGTGGATSIEANNSIGVAVVDLPLAVAYRDVVNNYLIESLSKAVHLTFLEYTIDGNNLLIYTRLAGDQGSIRVWSRLANNNWTLANVYLETPPPFITNLVRLSQVSRNFTSYVLTEEAGQHYIRLITLNTDGVTFTYSARSDPIPIPLPANPATEYQWQWLGGNSKTNPTFNFVVAGNHYLVEGVFPAYKITRTNLNYFIVDPLLDPANHLTRYKNSSYYVFNKVLKIANGTTGVITEYTLGSREYIAYLNDKGMTTIGRTSVVGDRLLITSYSNERADPTSGAITGVYKVSIDYGGYREFYYSLTSGETSLTIELNNLSDDSKVNVKNMEIFKVVLDTRIRYSKTKMDVNPATKCEEGVCEPGFTPESIQICNESCGYTGPMDDPNGQVDSKEKVDPECQDKCQRGDNSCVDKCKKRNCWTKCNRSVGGVARVLGYVGDDFSVSDFLNIYTTR